MSNDAAKKFPIHFAVMRGKTLAEVKKAIASCSKRKGAASQKNEQGRTPLHYAAAAGRIDITGLLVEQHQAEVDAVDAHGYTPLLRSLEGDHIETSMYLLEHGAGVLGVGSTSQNKNTPLHILVQSVSQEPDTLKLEVLHALLERQQPLDAVNARGRTSLWQAVASNSFLFVKQLLSFGADLRIPAPDETGTPVTPLSLALKNGFERVSQLLREAELALFPPPAAIPPAHPFPAAVVASEMEAVSSSVRLLRRLADSWAAKRSSISTSSLSLTSSTTPSSSQSLSTPNSPAIDSPIRFQSHEFLPNSPTADSHQPPVAPQPVQQSPVMMIAVHPYVSNRPDIMSIAVGDIVVWINQISPEWAEGLHSNGRRAIFAYPYCVPYGESANLLH